MDGPHRCGSDGERSQGMTPAGEGNRIGSPYLPKPIYTYNILTPYPQKTYCDIRNGFRSKFSLSKYIIDKGLSVL